MPSFGGRMSSLGRASVADCMEVVSVARSDSSELSTAIIYRAVVVACCSADVEKFLGLHYR